MSAATRIVRTFGSGNQKKWTMSFWMKVSRINYTDGGGGNSRQVFGQTLSNYCRFIITGSTQKIQFYESQGMDLRPSMVFRDFNAWYHIVVAVDTAQATAANRVKIYVNGVQQTAFDTETYPAQNADLHFNKSGTHDIGGSSAYGGYDYFNGLLSHVHLTDGYAYAASDFGSTDSTTGEWKINTSPSVSYGTTGYWILKDGNGLTDQSPNSNNWTLSTGTLTKTEDNPSNVFCTLNFLSTDSGVTLSSGNTESDYDGSVGHAKGTLGFSSGKFYWEVKIATAASNYPMLGIGSLDAANMQKPTGGSYPGGFAGSYGAYGNGNVYANGSNTGSQGFTWATNDIIGIAVDLDSGTKTIKWYKNGNATAIASTNITTDGPFASMDYNGGEAAVNLQYNFGNGYFGTTAVSSAGTNASNNGIFEYDVPAGYTALSTKGLNL